MTPIIAASLPNAQNITLNGTACTAHMLYAIDPSGCLCRRGTSFAVNGGIMLISGTVTDRAAEQILRECKARSFSGIAADSAEDIDGLAAAARFAKLSLYLPEALALRYDWTYALIASPVSSGGFKRRFDDAARHFGKGRVAAVLEPMQCAFSIPGGMKQELSDSELNALLSSIKTPAFFSGELCAKYAITQCGGGFKLIVFDDDASLKKKFSALRSMELGAMFVFSDDYARICRT